MFKTILFDIDGVLTSSVPFSKQLEREYGISIDISASFFRETFGDCLVGKLDTEQELLPYLQQWGWQRSVDEFLHYWFACMGVVNDPLVAYIQRLRQDGIPCYLATNQEKYRTIYILEQMDFASKFDGMFSSAYIGCLKDNTAYFEYILHTLKGIQPHEILFWDDLIINIETARETGLQAEQYIDFADFLEKMDKYLE